MNKLHALALGAFTALAFASTAIAQVPDPDPTPPPAPAPKGPAAPPAAPAAPAAPPAAAAVPPGQPKPYKDVLKDAKAIPGYFTLHQKDEKVWIEIRPEQLDKPFFFAANVPRSLGERGLYGSQMAGPWLAPGGDNQVVVWKKIGNQVQLIAKNTRFYAKAGTPQARFVAETLLRQPARLRARGRAARIRTPRRSWSRATRSSSPTCRATAPGSRARSACPSRSTRRTPASAA